MIMIVAAAHGAAMIGTVRDVSGDTATVTLEGQTAPAPGDGVDIFFQLAGTDQQIAVATGEVISTDGGSAKIKIEKATGEVKEGQLARFKPAKKVPPKASPTLPQKASPTPPPPPVPSPSTPPPASLPTPTAQRPTTDVHTPATGSPERVAICDGARTHVLSKYAHGKLPQPIVFKVEHLAVAGQYANLEAVAVYKNGRSVDQLPDIVYNFCLKNTGATWKVVYDLTRGDVPAASELETIRRSLPSDFPRNVLTSDWQQLLAK